MQSWIEAHWTVLAPVLAYVVATACLNLLFARYTDEQLVELAEKRPAFARWVTRLRGWGIDPIESVEFARTVATRYAKAPPALAATLLRLVGLGVVVACLACSGSQPAPNTPSKTATLRMEIVLAAEAIKAVDSACSDVVHAYEGTGAKDEALKLAELCTSLTRDAGAVLSAAADSLDTYDAAAEGEIRCAIGHAALGLDVLASIVQEHGGKVPPIARDALEVVGAIGTSSCPVVAAKDADDGAMADVAEVSR